MISINKPKYDMRTILGSTLNNNIKYITICDEHLEKSFVTVCINIGSYANPKNYDGMAHFLEHMLFMGSTKYPDENHYYDRLNELGGYSNAYTDTTKTVYYFNVFDNNMEEMLDIFSRFFIDPLFKADSIDREMNAVDSEHKKNIHNENWRKYQLLLHLRNGNSNNFGTGCIETLKHKDIREKMIEFYNTYYIPENISICIASSKSNKEQSKIIEKTFGNISSKKITQFEITKPFYKNNNNKIFFHKTLSDIFELTFLFEIPIINSKTDFHILNMFLISRSKKSLYFNLKNLGLINNIYINIEEDGVFSIVIVLTELGYSHIKTVSSIILSYIKKVIESDINNYIQYYKQILDINWTFMNKIDTEDLCNMLAENHHKTNTKDVYSYNYIIPKIEPATYYQKLYRKYINMNNMIIIISGKQYINKSYAFGNTNIVPYYNSEYCIILNKNNTKLYHSIKTPKFSNNNYINMNPQYISNLDHYIIPHEIYNNIWYGGNSQFGEPNIMILLQLQNNNFFITPKSYILTKISCSILNFLINTILYKPLEIGYSIIVEPNTILSSINIHINGLNDTLMLKKVMKELLHFIFNIHIYSTKISKEYIDNLINTFKLSIQNINLLNPYEYSSYIIKSKIYKTEFNNNILLEELDKINNMNIIDYMNNIFNNSILTGIFYGNIKKSKIKSISKNITSKFKSQNIEYPKINKLDNMIIIHPNSMEKSNCITYYYYVGNFLKKNIILLYLLLSILGQEFFNDLRTKQQLGYLVQMKQTKIRDEYYIVQVVQSDKTVETVENSIDEFNKNIISILKKANLPTHIITLKATLSEPDYNMTEKINRYIPEILNREYLFNRNKLLLKELSHDITLDMLVTFANDIMDKKSKIIIKGN